MVFVRFQMKFTETFSMVWATRTNAESYTVYALLAFNILQSSWIKCYNMSSSCWSIYEANIWCLGKCASSLIAFEDNRFPSQKEEVICGCWIMERQYIEIKSIWIRKFTFFFREYTLIIIESRVRFFKCMWLWLIATWFLIFSLIYLQYPLRFVKKILQFIVGWL